MATLEGADGMDGETSDRRQFLLMNPAVSRSALSCAPKDPGAPVFKIPPYCHGGKEIYRHGWRHLTATVAADRMPHECERRATSVQPVSVVEIRALRHTRLMAGHTRATAFAPFVAYVVVFHLAWIAWPLSFTRG